MAHQLPVPTGLRNDVTPLLTLIQPESLTWPNDSHFGPMHPRTNVNTRPSPVHPPYKTKQAPVTPLRAKTRGQKMGGEDDYAPAVTLPPKPPTSLSSVRFLGLLKQPEPDSRPPLELDERDVFWPPHLKPDPFDADDDSGSEPDPESDNRSPSKSNPHHRIHPASGFGLSAVFSDDRGLAVRRPARPHPSRIGRDPDAIAKSAPVNVPKWHARMRHPSPRFDDAIEEDDVDGGGGDEEEDDDGEMVPPHVIVARSHVTTFSVFEGIGRTLKGRDLRRVRNAVFQQTGFLDF